MLESAILKWDRRTNGTWRIRDVVLPSITNGTMLSAKQPNYIYI